MPETEMAPPGVTEGRQMSDTEQALIQEGRNQVLYLLLAIGDQNVAHDNWHPDRAQVLLETRQEIVKRLRIQTWWPKDWPDFETYLPCPG